MNNNDIIYKDIVLIGGGHAHALVVKMWGMKPIKGVRLTLISDAVHTPYSGMLPGLVSGHYSFKETHIDLLRLCSWANVRFICSKVSSLNSDKKSITMQGRPDIDYDILSINTGSTPNIQNTSGAAQFAIGVKPIAKFYRKWLQISQRMQTSVQPLNIALVGAGAGGFELLLAMSYAAKAQQSTTNKNSPSHRFHWIVANQRVLDGHNHSVQQQALALCKEVGINVHFDFRVSNVTDSSIESKASNISKETNNTEHKVLPVDEIIWCTAAKAASWPKEAGLAIDSHGFIAVNDFLQSTSNDCIFAVGDVATQINTPRPKAGVFAVRQGPVLYKNLCNAILEKPLKAHKPQRSFLSLLATGDKHAIASKGSFHAKGNWVWLWKNYIDQKFMRMFSQLPSKKSMQKTMLIKEELFPSLFNHNHFTSKKEEEIMRCGGCGAKVASSILSNVLKQVTADTPVVSREDVLIGLESPDDAAIINSGNSLLAQSVDQFRSIIDDPYLFAKIATNHALSDLHAMASSPQSALSIVAMPHAGPRIQERELYQLMYGVIEELNKANCSLIGGHTSEAAELSLGLCVNGLVDKTAIKTKSGIQPKQKLILTKPLGTGVIMAAHMQHKVDGEYVLNCMNTMLQSNQLAGNIFRQYDCSAMTDTTGFGFIGHLFEMLKGSDLTCILSISKLPVLTGAVALSNTGIKSTLFEKNLEFSQFITNSKQWEKEESYPLLFDPQTSGGLMAWVNDNQVSKCLEALIDAGYQAVEIATASIPTDINNQNRITIK